MRSLGQVETYCVKSRQPKILNAVYRRRMRGIFAFGKAFRNRSTVKRENRPFVQQIFEKGGSWTSFAVAVEITNQAIDNLYFLRGIAIKMNGKLGFNSQKIVG